MGVDQVGPPAAGLTPSARRSGGEQAAERKARAPRAAHGVSHRPRVGERLERTRRVAVARDRHAVHDLVVREVAGGGGHDANLDAGVAERAGEAVEERAGRVARVTRERVGDEEDAHVWRTRAPTGRA